MQKRVTALEGSLPQGLNAIQEKLSAAEAKSGSDLERIGQRVDALFNSSETAGQRLAGLEGGVGALNGRADSTSAELASSTRKAKVRLVGLVEILKTQVDAITRDLRSVEKTMKADLGNDAERLDSLGKRIETIDAGVKERVEKVQSELVDLRAELRDALRSVLRASVKTNPP